MIRCFGAITPGPNGKQMIHPQYQVFEKNEAIEIEKNLTPIYPTTSGLQQNKLKKIIESSLEFCEKNNLLQEESKNQNYSEFGNLLKTLQFLHKPPVETNLTVMALREIEAGTVSVENINDLKVDIADLEQEFSDELSAEDLPQS